ncbi:MAG: ABC transporter ATP-binding protein [Pseudomonadota bacterium]
MGRVFSTHAGREAEDYLADLIPRLVLRNLIRSFDGRRVVDDVSLTVWPGQVTCLLGPSGCGKSTTLRMIAGVEIPEAGEIIVDGEPIWKDGHDIPPELRQIGLMFQDFALFPHLSVADNVAFGLTGDAMQRAARVDELLRRVGLMRHKSSFPHELSGGEQQRVALARALAPKPRIMLMDEPFSGLDNRLRDGIRDETLEILREEGTGVLLVTHEPQEAMRMADEIALMRQGRIIQKGPPYELFTAPVDLDAVAFFSDINVVRAEVQGGVANTAFGEFASPGLSDGATVEIVARPQDIVLELDRNGRGPQPTKSHGTAVRGRVRRARFVGHESLVEFVMDHDGSIFRATVPTVFLPQPDSVMWVLIRRDRCFVFSDQIGE